MSTLLVKALATESKKRGRKNPLPSGDEAQELAIAWASGDVSLTQVSRVLVPGATASSNIIYCWCAQQLRDAIRSGKLVQKSPE